MFDKEIHVSISKGNIKMGAIPSVSLPPIITCSPEACRLCGKKCYANRICKLRKSVKESYERNLNLLKTEPEKYWREVNGAVALTSYFRFGVSGDIYDKEYFENMVKVAVCNTHCQILCFTKKFTIVNDWISEHGNLPENLHVIFSAWKGLTMVNPYNLPEAHVIYRDGYTTAKDGALFCSGNCSECAVCKKNCWVLKHGQQILFREH